MSKNTVELERPQITIWRRVECWISKVTRVQAHFCDRARTHARMHAPTHTHTKKYVD